MVAVVCSILSVGLVASCVWQRPFGSGRWRRHYCLVLTQFLFLPAVVAVGVLYRVSTNPTQPRPKVILLLIGASTFCSSYLWH